MSLYNMLFGMNEQSALLLAVIGLRKNDVERLRNVFAEQDGSKIYVYTRTGGGNREAYPNAIMRHGNGWVTSYDDEFDTTYCTDEFAVPVEFIKDVSKLGDVLGNGIRRKFGQHLIKTLSREPTDGDKEDAAYQSEQSALRLTKHEMANGHTFVPYDDGSMEAALKLAEANGGKLRSCWGILPLKLVIRENYLPYPNAKTRNWHMIRVDVQSKWEIDFEYWQHCQEVFINDYPLSMGKIAERVQEHLSRAPRAIG